MRADTQHSLADVEFLRQGVHLDPLLERISGFIDNRPELADAVRRDLDRGLKNPKPAGRAVAQSGPPLPDSHAHQELGLP